jgi:uncharacterized protein YndB with AHSA1/START domain
MKMASKNQTVVKVEPGKQELFITREFEAPRNLVFKAFTDEKLFARWFGPRDLTTTFDVFEPESGGRWRSVQRDKNGNEFAFHGVHHEVQAPERIIWTFEFEGMPESGHVLLETIRFEELPEQRTRITSQSVFQSVEDRDGMVAAGMEHGTVEGYLQLDDLLEEMQK